MKSGLPIMSISVTLSPELTAVYSAVRDKYPDVTDYEFLESIFRHGLMCLIDMLEVDNDG